MDESTTQPAGDTGAQDAQPVEAESQAQADSTPQEPVSDAQATASDDGAKTDKGSNIEDWAKAKGLDLNNPDDVKKAFKNFQEAEKKMHQSSQRSSELEDAYREQVDNLVEQNPALTAEAARLAKIELDVAVEKFFRSNPDAAQLEGDMAKLVQENPARANLPLEDLYQLARSKQSNREEVKAEGAKEALQSLAAKQKAASPNPSASQQGYSQAITREDVQQAVQRGDVAWIKKHTKEIDNLAFN